MAKAKKEMLCAHLDKARRERMSHAVREVGCPLDHCECGTHDVDQEYHSCTDRLAQARDNDLNEDIRKAELEAGWDSSP